MKPPRALREVTMELPRKLGFLMEPHPYKVAYGGRNSLKSWSFARALLTLGVQKDLRILCAREVQKSLADSVHQLLVDQIEALGYHNLYSISDNQITGTAKDTTIRFTGLSDITINNTKSIEGIDILWAEEADGISKRSWQVVLPTLFRTPNAECWVSFNPGLTTDDAWQRFVVNPPPDAVVVEMNWRDAVAAGWWQPRQEELRQRDLIYAKDDYENIWDGKPRSTVVGAIYHREVTEMVVSGRFCQVPYDPRLPVHRIWDLGWNDLMTVIMVQKTGPAALSIINYVEDARVSYPEMLSTMDALRYHWGRDWLPHDAEQHHPTSGTNARKQLQGLGCKVSDIPRTNPEARIKAGRMMFPRIYLDNGQRATPPEYPDRVIGGAHLMERLKHYKRHTTRNGQDRGPEHDLASHGSDAFGGLAEIVNRIRNDGDTPDIKLPGFYNAQPSMGLLG